MIRPTAAFSCAALVAVALGLGVSYAACPVQDVEISISTPSRAPSSEMETQGALHAVREYPATEGRLVSPFLPEHPTREQSRAMASAANSKPGKGLEPHRQAPPPQKEVEIRLVGVVSSEVGRRAILSVGKRQVLLAPGEEKDGVTLVSLADNAAIVSTTAGEKTLPLSLGNIK